ncbi:MAG: NAD(P)-dependent oxidoreductase, partial [Christensenella sp.]|nr:NAD(P)-dependent oxidoreductase [Christensenella sp.]
MFGMSEELLRLEEQGNPIKLAVIGAGQMGRGMVSQVVLMKGMVPSIVADIQLDNARNALLHAGVPEEMIREAKSGAEASDYIKQGKYVITEDAGVAIEADGIPCIVDATGVTEIGAQIAVKSIKAHKHIVMLNVEADVVVGP